MTSPGPRNPAQGMQPFELLPEHAVDLTLVWYWSDEPYASKVSENTASLFS